MLDKSIPYKDLIMKWGGNRQCLQPVCVPPGYRLRTWREGRPEKLGQDPEGGRRIWGYDPVADGGMVFTGIWGSEEEAFLPMPVCRKHGQRSRRRLHGMDRGGNGWEPYSLPSLAGSAGYKKRPGHWNCPGPRGPADIRGPGRDPGLSAYPALELRGCGPVFKGWFFPVQE